MSGDAHLQTPVTQMRPMYSSATTMGGNASDPHSPTPDGGRTLQSLRSPADIENLDREELARLLEEATALKAERDQKRKLTRMVFEAEQDDDRDHDRPLKQPRYEDTPRNGFAPRITMRTPEYKNPSSANLKTFLSDLKAIFAMSSSYHDRNQRVLFASSCLRDAVKRRWTLHLENKLGGDFNAVTWDQFEEFLWTTIGSESSRAIDAASTVMSLSQANDQSFRDYADAWEEAVAELPSMISEDVQVALCLVNTKQQLRLQILSQGVPKTWNGFISAGTSAELMLANQTTTQGHSGARHQGHSGSMTRMGAANSSAANTNNFSSPSSRRDPHRGSAGDSKAFCWKCGRPGHISYHCPEPDCAECHDRRHTTDRHVQPTGPLGTTTRPNNNPIGVRGASA